MKIHPNRSASNRWFAGICGGIAEYTKIPSILIRLLFVALRLVTIPLSAFLSLLIFIAALYLLPGAPARKTIEYRGVVDAEFEVKEGDPMQDPAHDLTEPPFNLPQFEQAYRTSFDEHSLAPRKVAVFIPCVVPNPTAKARATNSFAKCSAKVFLNTGQLEPVYPYARYHYMLSNVKGPRTKDGFLCSEIRRIAGYLEKTRSTYEKRIAYCIGIFCTAVEAAVAETRIPVEIYPTRPVTGELLAVPIRAREA
ncbi:MAG TPA: PspC domain-containing protein [Methanocorpusculum sp.]|nr:PspC domain-containing protein [Methanocorpusculum sp.]